MSRMMKPTTNLGVWITFECDSDYCAMLVYWWSNPAKVAAIPENVVSVHMPFEGY